jgi:phosphoribosylformimino-5-aminoimidazole carboxamide ribotide isomerase
VRNGADCIEREANVRIIPVVDVMRGEAVRGVGGRRHEYRPLVSRLTPSSRPLDVVAALASHFGREEFYVADLDAILGGEPAWPLFAALHERGFRLWVDAGVRDRTRAHRLAEAEIDTIVVGLETVAHPDELAALVRTFGTRIVFSLDLRAGEPMNASTAWPSSDAESIAGHALELGVSRLLVLDLARVGCASGTGTEALCSRLHAAYPHVALAAGGGVRQRGDLEELLVCGVQTALVASALHDGRLTRADLDAL